MDEASLNALETAVRDKGFWSAADSLVLLPPHLSGWRGEAEEALVRERLPASLVFATSGSTGSPKLVVLSKRALAFSAESVNQFLGVSRDDRWFLALPAFHVGGASILLRASLGGASVHTWRARWDPPMAARAVEEAGATLVSLVPTQLFDLVSAAIRAPSRLRAAIVGGGRLEPNLRRCALELGWPILETYGMTETASQVAARWAGEGEGEAGDPGFRPLSGWRVRVEDPPSGRLWLSGGALLEGYLERRIDRGPLRFRDPKLDGWFATGDRAEWADGRLRGIERLGRTVKVLGELVSLERLEGELTRHFRDVRVGGPDGGSDAATGIADPAAVVVAVPDARRGSRLVAVVEGDPGASASSPSNAGRRLRGAVALLHASCPGFERISALAVLAGPFPRSPMGKVLHGELERMATTALRGHESSGTGKNRPILLEMLEDWTISSGSYGQEMLD